MSAFDQDNRTEKPTPRRRGKARTEGQVARSMELNSALLLTVASLMMILYGGYLFSGLSRTMASIFSEIGSVEITVGVLPHYLSMGMKTIGLLLAPLFVVVIAAGLLSNIGQVGFKVTPKAAKPKWDRMNPIKGFGRLFSLRSLIELAKSILKLALVGGVVYLIISAEKERIYSLAVTPVEIFGSVVGTLLGRVFLVASLSLLLVGIIDYLYNKHEFEKSLKMTKEEVKDEHKQTEGDQKVKGKIREIMIRTTLRRMMAKVPEADVVITNPIHLAVALKYERSKGSAPIVLAKGARKVAERIKEIARENDIPIVENKPLAQMLFKLVDIGQEIPVELYKAVAEVLAYVYRLKKKFFGVA